MIATTPLPVGRRTVTAEAAGMLCYGMRTGWRGWAEYLSQCDLFNRVPR